MAKRPDPRSRPARSGGRTRNASRRPAKAPRDTQFRPDRQASVLKTLRLTQLQRQRMLKWGLYALVLLLALVIQDVIMSGVQLLGATTDLAVCVILLITVIEGVETGSLYVLAASVLYFYSGTAPFAYSIGLLSFLGIFACLIRQMYLSRSRAAIVLCAGAAAMLYELGLWGVGVFLGLTRWDRVGVFALTGLIDILTMIPLYTLICKIGLIGGNTWKE